MEKEFGACKFHYVNVSSSYNQQSVSVD